MLHACLWFWVALQLGLVHLQYGSGSGKWMERSFNWWAGTEQSPALQYYYEDSFYTTAVSAQALEPGAKSIFSLKKIVSLEHRVPRNCCDGECPRVGCWPTAIQWSKNTLLYCKYCSLRGTPQQSEPWPKLSNSGKSGDSFYFQGFLGQVHYLQISSGQNQPWQHPKFKKRGSPICH